MSEASNRDYDNEQHAVNGLDGNENGEGRQSASGPSEVQDPSTIGIDSNSVLTKVANLLDDIIEPEPISPVQPSSMSNTLDTPVSDPRTDAESTDGKRQVNDRPSENNSAAVGDTPSLNSSWIRATASQQEAQTDVPGDAAESYPEIRPSTQPLDEPFSQPLGQDTESQSAANLDGQTAHSDHSELDDVHPSPDNSFTFQDSSTALDSHTASGTEPAQEQPAQAQTWNATPQSDISANISLKGRGDGVAVELGTGDWNRILAHLDTRLEQAAAFFRGGQVSLDVGPRPLVEVELDQVCSVLRKYGLTVGIIRTGSDRTFQSALNLGLAATMENAGGATMSEATYAASNLGGQTHFVYRGTLRSGQVLQRQESILIIGDVNPGGHVISAGDIMVWGRLRGLAHAGSEGDLNVIVGALLLAPTQLRIASIIAINTNRNEGPRRDKQQQQDEIQQAEVGFVTEGKIVVRPWQDARRGLRSVLRSS